MKEDPKMHKYWGNSFFPPGPEEGEAASPNRYIPERGKWECWEFMVKCNTPGEHDGEQAMWVNGKKLGEFKNILWRISPEVRANCLWLLHYGFDSGDPTRGSWKKEDGKPMRDTVWFDDVVVSTEYIGPKDSR
jgi:hypothetical protein